MKLGAKILGVCVLSAALLVYSIGKVEGAHSKALVEGERGAVWVRPVDGAGAVSYFRRRLRLDMEVDRAWARVEADGGFVLYVNGDPALKNEYWRPTRPASNGLSAWGQRVFRDEPAIGLNFPREYQWGDRAGVSLAPYVDLTPYLHEGDNVITIVAQARTLVPAVRLDGSVLLTGGEEISIQTGHEWEAASPPFDVSPNDLIRGHGGGFSSADLASGPPGWSFCTADGYAFQLPFEASWVTATLIEPELSVRFHGRWFVAEEGPESWVRVLADRPYQLFINGERHRGASRKAPSLSCGDWIYSSAGVADVITRPRPADPDDLMSPFELSRRKDDGRWRPPSDLVLDHVMGRGGEPGVVAALGERRSDEIGRHVEAAAMDHVRPYGVSGGFVREEGSLRTSFSAHEVTGLLKSGWNDLEVVVSAVGRDERESDEVGVAVDFFANAGGSPSAGSSSHTGWTAEASGGRALDLFEGSAPHQSGPLAGLEWIPNDSRPAVPSSSRMILSLGALLVAWLVSILGAARSLRLGPWPLSADQVCARSFVLLLLPIGLVAASISMAELTEGVVFSTAMPWVLCALICVLAPVVAWLPKAGPYRAGSFGGASVMANRAASWGVVLLLLAALTLALRLWAVEWQPLDDDEYASYQAIQAIVATGAPLLDSGVVMYTRGPLYHYLVAGFVMALGDEVWVFRLPSALFGLATGLLLYRIGSKYMRSRAMGACAFGLFAIHPYCVFTGHVIRFYQQQQFFALLTCYLLVEGYVRRGTLWARSMCVLASIASVLTQEISVIIGVQIAVAFLLFRGKRRFVSDFHPMMIGAIGAFVVGLDYAAFKVMCLTLTEGVSANVEAKISPNLTKLYNTASLFLGYSRLHLVGSVFLAPSLAYALWKGSRHWLGFHFVLWTGVLLSNVLITHVSLRYQYWLIPIWLLLVCHGLVVSSSWLARLVSAGPASHRKMAVQGQVMGLILIVTCWAPWRIPSSYSSTLLGDSTGALGFVASRMVPDDRVFVTEPHSHAALVETGRVDGYLSFPLLHDFHVSVDGVMVDRNGGAPVISDLGSIKSAFSEPGRIWIAVNREKWRGRAKNLRWEYPGARAELFVRQNCSLEYQTYLWDVFLWDPAKGSYDHFDVAMK